MRHYTPSLIATSERIYTALLILYPTSYRRDYGPQMVQVFRDMSRDMYARQGVAGIARWWCATLLDLVRTTVEQWGKVRFAMSRTLLMQLTGILLIVGGACAALASISQLQPGSHYTYRDLYQLSMWMIMPTYLLLGSASFGLALRYGTPVGQIGRLALIVMGIGGLLMAVVFVPAMLVDSLWMVMMAGLLTHTIGTLLFGCLHLWKPVLPVFRWLPLLAGAAPLLMFFGILRTSAGNGADLGTFAYLVIFGAVWIVIGLSVQRQQARSLSLAA